MIDWLIDSWIGIKSLSNNYFAAYFDHLTTSKAEVLLKALYKIHMRLLSGILSEIAVYQIHNTSRDSKPIIFKEGVPLLDKQEESLFSRTRNTASQSNITWALLTRYLVGCRYQTTSEYSTPGMVNMGNESCLTSRQTSKLSDVVKIDMLAGILVTVHHNRIWQTAEKEDISLQLWPHFD